MLTRLVEIGMEIAEAAGRRAVAALEGEAPPATTAGDPALAYARAARAVRMTIALQARLLKDLPALDRADAVVRSEAAHARRRRIHRLVEQAIAAGGEDADEIEQLSDDAWERLRDADEYAALMTCPLAEAAARIAKDLGLSPDGCAWAMEPWALSGSGFDPGYLPPLGEDQVVHFRRDERILGQGAGGGGGGGPSGPPGPRGP